ncbi:oligosaccharide biosynthesis protein Alg14-like protein, partial [Mycena galopus ATCC 62051]
TLYTILTILRARYVHQRLITTPPTALRSLLMCFYHVTFAHIHSSFADILILNGPGTCFVLCITVYVNKFQSLATPRVIHIESFSRVESLSLSGNCSIHLFIVRWPQLQAKVKGAEFHGLLV